MVLSNPILWSPSPERQSRSRIADYLVTRNVAGSSLQEKLSNLHAWAITAPSNFWGDLWDYLGIVGEKGTGPYVRPPPDLNPGNDSFPCLPGYGWFPAARLNFAENLLRPASEPAMRTKAALIFHGEGIVRRELSWHELKAAVSSLAADFRARGVSTGDRVAAIVANSPEAVIGMLAAASIGAIWSSCSPDFGVPGILDRFGQIEPKVLIACDGYFHKGKRIDVTAKVIEVRRSIPTIQSVYLYHYAGGTNSVPGAVSLEDCLKTQAPDSSFARLPFGHPLYIMYSSGTTGKPKCIVHSAGGTLLEHLKELHLHVDLRPQERILYQTTCGWMMWNWLVSSLAVGATVVLYDGSPLERGGRILFDIAEQEQLSVFGTNAKFLAEIEKSGLSPRTDHHFPHLHTILSTGSVLAPESFEYVYRAIHPEVLLASISGGTDIIGCFALGCPLLPVRRGELQTKSLGLDVDVVNERGVSVRGEKGELVCRNPFPSMPVSFWGDPDGSKYRAAYFERFPGLWHHGDYVEVQPEGGLVFYGRSDATLKPGGVRIGTAEIYRQVERLPQILESLVVGQSWKGDTRIVLFVRLREGEQLTAELQETIRRTVRLNASPFHVPKKIIAVPDIPRTRSGKIVELAVRDIIHGVPIKNREALLNPEALEWFARLTELTEE